VAARRERAAGRADVPHRRADVHCRGRSRITPVADGKPIAFLAIDFDPLEAFSTL